MASVRVTLEQAAVDKVKKLNPKVVTLAFIVLSMLVACGFAVRNVVAPGGGGVEGEFEPTGG